MQSSATPAPRDRQELTVQEIAETFVGRMMDGAPVGLDVIHQATVRHLVQTKYITLARAKVEAAKAVGAMNARATSARFDTEHCTTTCIFITHEGETHAMTIVEALALCKSQSWAPTS